MKKKILITGGAGFIGYHLAKRLAAQGYAITLADNFFRGKRNADFEALIKKPNVRFIKTDLTKLKNWDKLGAGFDQVYHLVGINGTKLFYSIPHEVLRIGVSTTMNALEWFRAKNRKKNAKILYTSSNEAYASALEAFGKLPLPTPEAVPLVISDPYNPRWSYGGSKLIGELLVIHYAKAYNFPAVIVRPHNFYGPRAGYDHVLPEWCQKIMNRMDPFILYSPEETRTFCYISDGMEAMQLLMDSAATNDQPIQTVHIGNTDEISMQDLAKKLFSVAGWEPSQLEFKPSPPGSVKRRCADITKIQNLIGWQPATSLEDGLRKTWEWYQKNPAPVKNG